MTSHPAEEAIRSFFASYDSPINRAQSIRYNPRYSDLTQLIIDKLVELGIDPSFIRFNKNLNLPGSYGVNRPWDLIVTMDEIPVAAIEIKMATGTTIGHNFGNRTSDIISMATDVDRQYSTEELRLYKPCLGILFVLEENETSTRPVLERRGVIRTEENSEPGSSYKERYESFFKKLLQDRMYDAACYLTVTPSPSLEVSEPHVEMGFENFLTTIVQRISDLNSLKDSLELDSVKFGKILALRDDLDHVMSGITSTSIGLSVAEQAVIERRRSTVRYLIDLTLNENVNETQMQKAIGNHYWIFGGQYVGVAPRRDLMPLDEHDIPLICADGSLEIVELKGPESRIVKRHRNHIIVSNEVHEAVSQCMSYLRTIDEMGAALRTSHRNELGLDYDYRRARGVVVIGHPERAKLEGATREIIDQAIRSYNAHLSRVRVTTYADLLESAERMLKFESEVSREA